MWDITIHVSEDIEVLLGPKLSLANVVFLLSRSVNHTLSRLHFVSPLFQLTLIEHLLLDNQWLLSYSPVRVPHIYIWSFI